MPELAEVEFYRKQWDCGLGQRVERVHLHASARVFRDSKPRVIRKALPGCVFRESRTHGKQLLFGFEPGVWLSAHLGMTGMLVTGAADHQPEKHDHLVLFQAERALIFRDARKFGHIRIDRGEKPPAWWAELPPEVHSREFTEELVASFLARRPKSAIKAVLLDQAGFPGIGNWMADEILWRVQLHPATRCREIPRATSRQLWQEVRRVSLEALSIVGTDWGDFPDNWLFNHRWKDGGICPRYACKEPLVRKELRSRTTCWCPKCQAPM